MSFVSIKADVGVDVLGAPQYIDMGININVMNERKIYFTQNKNMNWSSRTSTPTHIVNIAMLF